MHSLRDDPFPISNDINRHMHNIYVKMVYLHLKILTFFSNYQNHTTKLETVIVGAACILPLHI
jgi:hypothetical protein